MDADFVGTLIPALKGRDKLAQGEERSDVTLGNRLAIKVGL